MSGRQRHRPWFRVPTIFDDIVLSGHNLWMPLGSQPDRRPIASSSNGYDWTPISYYDRHWKQCADGSWASYDPRLIRFR